MKKHQKFIGIICKDSVFSLQHFSVNKTVQREDFIDKHIYRHNRAGKHFKKWSWYNLVIGAEISIIYELGIFCWQEQWNMTEKLQSLKKMGGRTSRVNSWKAELGKDYVLKVQLKYCSEFNKSKIFDHFILAYVPHSSRVSENAQIQSYS